MCVHLQHLALRYSDVNAGGFGRVVKPADMLPADKDIRNAVKYSERAAERPPKTAKGQLKGSEKIVEKQSKAAPYSSLNGVCPNVREESCRQRTGGQTGGGL